MGNSLGCSAHGERLVAAARDGDVAESRRLLEINRSLARYSTFAGLSSPLHAAAGRGHSEIVTMLLESRADVNSRNFGGQTALMHACRYGHWETVQTLLLFRCNVLKVEYLSGRTALHFSAAGGHVRCIRLLAADFVPDVRHVSTDSLKDDRNVSIPNSLSARGYDEYALSRYVNKVASGGMSALHLAALIGNSDCVHLLLDLGADVSAVTQFYASPTTAIGAGSSPLHYAACSGNLKCCQILLARGASRLTRNYDGLLPADIARIWGCHWLLPMLSPHSTLIIPIFPPSDYLSLPLRSILKIAREHGLQSSPATADESDLCAVCLERACTVAAEGCGHELCTGCALCLCSASNTKSELASTPGSIPCPLCRDGIVSFTPLVNKLKTEDTGLCDRLDLQPHHEKTACLSDFHKNGLAGFPSELTGPTSGSTGDNSSWQSSEPETNLDVTKEQKVEETSCSASFVVNGGSSQTGPERNIEINA